MSTPQPEQDTTWPEPAMVRVQDEVGFHVRIAQRLYAISVLTELIADMRRDHRPVLEPIAELHEAKIRQLRELNRIDQLEHRR